MSEIRAFLLLLTAGLTAMSSLFVGLTVLGASGELVTLSYIVCLVVTCGLIGFLPDDGSRDRR